METKLHLSPVFCFLGVLVNRLGAAMARFARPAGADHPSLAAEELRAMSDLELRDLGIGRSEIPRVLGDARVRA